MQEILYRYTIKLNRVSRRPQSAPVAIGNALAVEHGTPADSLLFGTSLSSSSGKTKRPTTLKNRRLSSSTLRPGALSLPVQSGFPSSSRGRSASTSQTLGEDDEEGEIKPGSRKPKGETYACEKCNKVRSVGSRVPKQAIVVAPHQRAGQAEVDSVADWSSSGAR